MQKIAKPIDGKQFEQGDKEKNRETITANVVFPAIDWFRTIRCSIG